jgi:hypothetical protein
MKPSPVVIAILGSMLAPAIDHPQDVGVTSPVVYDGSVIRETPHQEHPHDNEPERPGERLRMPKAEAYVSSSVAPVTAGIAMGMIPYRLR